MHKERFNLNAVRIFLAYLKTWPPLKALVDRNLESQNVGVPTTQSRGNGFNA
jgi:hypothetical protein